MATALTTRSHRLLGAKQGPELQRQLRSSIGILIYPVSCFGEIFNGGSLRYFEFYSQIFLYGSISNSNSNNYKPHKMQLNRKLCARPGPAAGQAGLALPVES